MLLQRKCVTSQRPPVCTPLSEWCFDEVRQDRLHWTCFINAWIIKFHCPRSIFMQSHSLCVSVNPSLTLSLPPIQAFARLLSRPILLAFFKVSAPVFQIHLCMDFNDLGGTNGSAHCVSHLSYLSQIYNELFKIVPITQAVKLFVRALASITFWQSTNTDNMLTRMLLLLHRNYLIVWK